MPGSFRDPRARVFTADGRVFRALSGEALEDWNAFSRSRAFRKRLLGGNLVRTWVTGQMPRLPPPVGGGEWATVLEHEPIPFVSYPSEWSFSMLQDAALLQLDLMLDALDEGFILHDGVASNVQWSGCRPVFVDIPSFRRLRPGQAWPGYRQFCQQQLFPLMLSSLARVPFHPWLRGRPDGITPREIAALLPLRSLLRPSVFPHVVLQCLLEGLLAGSSVDMPALLREGNFSPRLIRRNAGKLRSLVAGLPPPRGNSAWTGYGAGDHPAGEAVEAKRRFVERCAASRTWDIVWDLGCNTGGYSRIAASRARIVVAVDADAEVVDIQYLRLKAERIAGILPLVIDLADPSPAPGWLGTERASLEERGRPGLVLCLATIHHLAVTSGLPLGEIAGWLGSLGGSLILEFVTREDPAIGRLLRGREDGAPGYDAGGFESTLLKEFTIADRMPLPGGTRILYFAHPLRKTTVRR